MNIQDNFLAKIERFLIRKGLSATRFGTESLCDPNFVFDLRKGIRSLKLDTVEKVKAYMKSYRKEVKDA